MPSRAEVCARLRRLGLPVTLYGETDAERLSRLTGGGVAAVSGVKRRREPVADAASAPLAGAASVAAASGGDAAGAGAGAPAPPALSAEQGHPAAANGGTSGVGAVGGGASGEDAAGAASEDTAAAAAATAGAPAAAAGDSGDDGSDGSGDDGAAGGGAGGAPPARRRYTHEAARPFAPDARGAGGDAHKFLYKFWSGALLEWEDELRARDAEAVASPAGRAATRVWELAREHVRPFLKRCKRRTLPPDILALCVEVARELLAREHARAADAYMRLAVGKAQWLIGVSQVGLHERIARERVYVGKITHVMNDEVQRKYITTLKRLMSWLQHKYPNADPSRNFLAS